MIDEALQLPTAVIRRQLGRYRVVPLLLAMVAALVTFRLLSWPAPIEAIDRQQQRLNIAAPVPNGAQRLSQTLQPTVDGFSAIELLVVRYDDRADGFLSITLHDDQANLVASERLRTSAYAHNDSYTLNFDSQADSAGRTYTLTLSGEENAALTFWAYSLDTMPGELLGGEQARELRYVLRYHLTPRAAFAALSAMIGRSLPQLLLTLLLLPLPGLLLLQLLQSQYGKDFAVHAALTFVLGVAIWPLLWLWPTLIGWRWSQLSLWLLVIALVVLSGVLHLSGRRRLPQLRLNSAHLPLLFITLLSLLLRLLAVRDTAFPAWVDGSRHGLITSVMLQTGQFLTSYRPLLAVDGALYHYGYHTIPASVLLMLPADLGQTLLLQGQLLGALLPPILYAVVRLLNRSRRAALLAALLVALPLFFPAYYTSWGRLTQLSGMLILPLLLPLTWRLTSAKPRRVDLLLVAILSAGLFLIHFRVLLIYLPFALVVWLLPVDRHGRRRNWSPSWRLPAAAAAALLLTLPRLLQLSRPAAATTIFITPDGYNDFPTAYLSVGWDEYLLLAAAAALTLALLIAAGSTRWLAGLLLVALFAWSAGGEWLGTMPTLEGVHYLRSGLLLLLLTVALQRQRSGRQLAVMLGLWLASAFFVRDSQTSVALLAAGAVLLLLATQISAKRWAYQALIVAAWVALLILPLLADRVGLPATWVINLNSVTITLFLPLTLLLALALDAVWRWSAQQHWLLHLAAYCAAGLLFALLLQHGVVQQIAILNDATLLARPADRVAIDWLDANLPDDAVIAVNSWHWLGHIWAANDGGGWITPLTGRTTTTPPADYSYSLALTERVNGFNEQAAAIEDWSTPVALDLLRTAGVTHIYAGARGGFLAPHELLQQPAITPLYSQDGVIIMQLAAAER